MTKASDRMELLTIIGQAIVLSAGFALVFSWEAEIQAKLLALIILILLILIYPMPDRLNNKMEEKFIELYKAHGFTQGLIFELKESIPGTIEDDRLTPEERLEKAHKVKDELEKFHLRYSKSFDATFKNERELSGRDKFEFFADSLTLVLYLIGLIGISALIGWFGSLLF